MSRRRRGKLLITGNRWCSARTVFRYFLPVAVIITATVTTAALVPRPGAAAAAAPAAAASPGIDPEDVSWTPDGTPVQENTSGVCEVAMSGTLGEPDASIASQVAAVLNGEQPVQVNQDGIVGLAVVVPEVGAGSTSMTVDADAGVDCSLVNQTDAYIKKDGYASFGRFVQAVSDARLDPARPGSPRAVQQHAVLLAYDAVPAWLRAAVAAVVGSVLYVAISALVGSALVMLGVPPNAAALAFSGCVGGAVGAAVVAAIAGGSLGPLNPIPTAVGGCFAGAILTLVSDVSVKQLLSTLIGVVLTSNLTTVFGSEVTADAAAAGADLSPVNTAVQDTTEALNTP